MINIIINYYYLLLLDRSLCGMLFYPPLVLAKWLEHAESFLLSSHVRGLEPAGLPSNLAHLVLLLTSICGKKTTNTHIYEPSCKF